MAPARLLAAGAWKEEGDGEGGGECWASAAVERAVGRRDACIFPWRQVLFFLLTLCDSPASGGSQ